MKKAYMFRIYPNKNQDVILNRTLPICDFDLSPGNNFCPHCGREIKTKCSGCNNYRYKDLGYCPSCGKRDDAQDTEESN